MLKLDKLTKKFGKLAAVDEISLEVQEGEIFGFLGQNGAGKTTTIKLIAGLLMPSAGQVLIDGIDVNEDPVRAKASLAYIPDEPYLYEKLTGREQLELVGRMHAIEEQEVRERIEQLLGLFHVDDYADQFTEDYSHGTRQKFVFATAFLPRPRLILIDEPMVGLDPQNAHLVKEVLKQIAGENRVTIFLSTHTLSLAQEICDRIGIIHKGKLLACGTQDELKALARSDDRNLEEHFLHLTGQYRRERIAW